MRAFAGPGSSVEFTHLSKAAGASLTQTFSARNDADLSDAECHTEGVLEFGSRRRLPGGSPPEGCVAPLPHWVSTFKKAAPLPNIAGQPLLATLSSARPMHHQPEGNAPS